jgi:hypothetical protein
MDSVYLSVQVALTLDGERYGLSGPTDWRSAAASALYRTTFKTNDLAREAVSWNAGLGGGFALLRL